MHIHTDMHTIHTRYARDIHVIQQRYRQDITVHIVCIVCICMYLYVSCMYICYKYTCLKRDTCGYRNACIGVYWFRVHVSVCIRAYRMYPVCPSDMCSYVHVSICYQSVCWLLTQAHCDGYTPSFETSL